MYMLDVRRMYLHKNRPTYIHAADVEKSLPGVQ